MFTQICTILVSLNILLVCSDPFDICEFCELSTNCLFAHPLESTMYVQCVNHISIFRTCPDDLIWDIDLSICNNRPINFEDECSSCPIKDTSIECFLPDYTNSSRYIQCSQGIPVPQECASGLFWVHEDTVCKKPDLRIGVCQNCPGEQLYCYLENELDEKNFTVCSNGVPFEKTCGDNLVWFQDSLMCDWKVEDPLTDFVGACKNCASSSHICFYEDDTVPKNNSVFIQCSNGKPHYMSCPHGLHFSTNHNVCAG